jgi:hypothetical protein
LLQHKTFFLGEGSYEGVIIPYGEQRLATCYNQDNP